MELWVNNMPYQNSDIEFMPYLIPYLIKGARLAVVVCPGGGYGRRGDNEGKRYAEWLNTIGVSAVVLEYRVAPYKAPAAVCDLQRAVRVVRKELFNVGVKKIGVMGSSAGGHLAATTSVHYDKAFYVPVDDIDEVSARPDFTILCYPVIDMYEFRHDGSRNNFIGCKPKKSEKDFYSPYLHVTDDTPPAFMWHTSNDIWVSAENSMLYAGALSEHNIPYELHIYPDGPHGLGLAKNNPYVSQWTEALRRWLNTYV